MEYQLKIVVIGDAKVGKTTWIENHQHYEPYAITTGVDFRIKEYSVNAVNYTLHYWDCPGAQRSKYMVPPFCAGAAYVVYVYDVGSHPSFESLTEWHALLCKDAANDHIEKILLGNIPGDEHYKKKRSVGRDEAQRFATEHKMNFIEATLGTPQGNMQVEKYILEKIDSLIKEDADPVNLMQRNIEVKPISIEG